MTATALIPEHPVPTAGRITVWMEEADADLGAPLLGRHGLGPELDVEAGRGQHADRDEAGYHSI